MKNAKIDYISRNYESACRKYEEVSTKQNLKLFSQAYSIWRFYNSNNPNWSTEGIDDSKIEEVDWKGNTPFEIS